MRPTVLVVLTAMALSACSTGGGATPTAAPTRTSASASASHSPTSRPTSASPTPSASPSSTLKPGFTAVTVTLQDDANCPGGRVGAHNTLRPSVWEVFGRIPASGVVTLAVPTAFTRGMAFDVQCRSWPSTGAVPIVVLQYAEAAVGDPTPVEPTGRPVGEKASYCWAGTKATAYAIDVRGWIEPGDGGPLSGKVALYADPTVATIGYSTGERWQDAPDGQMGHQDEPYC